MAGNYKEVEELLSQGYTIKDYSSSPSHNNRTYVPLDCAAIEGNADMISWLLKRGACDRNGSAVKLASGYPGGLDAVKCLLSNNAKATYKETSGWTALHYAAQGNALETVKLLLDHKADVHALTNDKRTPLHVASNFSGADIARVLLSFGAATGAQDVEGCIPLHSTPFSKVGEGAAIAIALLARGADIEARTTLGNTTLFTACKEAQKDLVAVLLTRGADVNNFCGSTSPLARAKMSRENASSPSKIARLDDIIRMLKHVKLHIRVQSSIVSNTPICVGQKASWRS